MEHDKFRYSTLIIDCVHERLLERVELHCIGSIYIFDYDTRTQASHNYRSVLLNFLKVDFDTSWLVRGTSSWLLRPNSIEK